MKRAKEEGARLWLKESARRLKELESGRVKAVPGASVMRELRDLLG